VLETTGVQGALGIPPVEVEAPAAVLPREAVRMRVLVVEDEAAVAKRLKRWLEESGFQVALAANGETAWFLGDTEDFTAVILDLGLPRIDGLTVLRRWRQAGRKVPVIVLTARGSWKERVDGIDAGADDYLPKPFQTEELIARLHAVLRRTAGHISNTCTIGPLMVDNRRKMVTLHGEPVNLTALEFRLLSCFLLQPNAVISTVDLLENLYGHDHEKDVNAFETVLRRLRKKIGPELIGTRRGQGYYLKAQ
jgi:two-component system, OmpR family, response regulator